jgi:hypothetical protein
MPTCQVAEYTTFAIFKTWCNLSDSYIMVSKVSISRFDFR